MKNTNLHTMQKSTYFRVCCLLFFLFLQSFGTLSANNLIDSTYCESYGTSPWQEWIQNIKIQNPDQTVTYLDNTSFKEGYGDFTNQVVVLQKSGSDFSVENRLEVTAGYSWNSYDEYVAAWIDFNQNGFFDANEQIFSEPISAPPNGTLSGSEWDTFIIPFDALTGETRMRVSMQRDAYVNGPCEIFALGEVEDYTIMIEASPEVNCSGDITLTTQAEVDAFGPCTVYDGSIEINGLSSDITNLDALIGLTEVTGDLAIQGTDLADLNALSSLETIGGNFFLSSIANLQDITDLSNLTSIGLGLVFENLTNLLTLDGLQNLTSINKEYLVLINIGVSNLDELSGIDEIGEFIVIRSNANLLNIDGLASATKSSLEELEINNNLNLLNIDGLAGLNTVENLVFIYGNENLASVAGLSDLTTAGTFVIDGNNGLVSLDGLENLSTVTTGSLRVGNNDLLSECCAIFPIINNGGVVSGDISIEDNLSGCNSVNDILTNCGSSPVCSGDIILTTQAEVNAFGPCTVWDGNIEIDALFSDITNIDSLFGLTEVTGNIGISGTDLTHLNALSTLETIGGNLFLSSMTELQNINGLSNLTSTGDGLVLVDLPNLSSLDGLQNLTSINNERLVLINLGVSNFDELSNIDSLSRFFIIRSNEKLVNIDGLASIVKNNVEQLEVNGNAKLKSVNGMAGLTSVSETAFIFGNAELMDITGFSSLVTAGSFILDGNNALESIAGLENLASVPLGSLRIGNNELLSVCCAVLPILENDGAANVSIEDNLPGCNSESEVFASCGNTPVCFGDIILSNQAEVDAFGPCTSWDGDIVITGDSITNLAALAGLQSVSGKLEIAATSLTNLNGLSDLESVGNVFVIIQNDQLQDISALSSLTSVGNMVLINLPQLTNLNGLQNLQTLETGLLNITGTGIDNLDELTGITEMTELVINGNNNLTNISGLTSVNKTDMTVVEILGNAQLTSLDGLSGIVTTTSDLLIIDNAQLVDITALSTLTTIGGALVIFDNDALTNLDGLDNLMTITGSTAPNFFAVNVRNNDNLSDCCALYPFLTNGTIGGGLVVFEGNAEGCNSLQEVLDNCGGSPVCSGDITLSTQAEVDAFGPCTTWDGNITITGTGVLNLFNLAGLETINGSLTISNADSLYNLNGLNNLTTINEGGFVILDNDMLLNFDGLNSLEFVETTFAVVSNPNLVNVSSLSNFTTVDDLVFFQNASIPNLNGLENLNVTSSLTIESNGQLTSIGALPALPANFVSASIQINEMLTDLSPLSGITNIDNLTLVSNGNNNLDDLSGLTTINNLTIATSPSLTNLDGLSNIVTVNNLNIVGNDNLSDCCGIYNLLNNGVLSGDLLLADNQMGCNSAEEILTSCGEPVGEYCAAQSTSPWQEWIAGFETSLINNPSGKCDGVCGYTDFTALSTDLDIGVNYGTTLTPGLSWSGHVADLYWRVWIDYNQDGDFEDSNELALQAYGGSDVVGGIILVPFGTPEGTTRMRVAAKRGGYAGPCETFERGEVEDYTVNITNGFFSGITFECLDDEVILVPPNGAPSSGQCIGTIPIPFPIATTNCTTGELNFTLNHTIIDGNISVNSPGGSCGWAYLTGIGTAELQVTATDDCGNTETCVRQITVGILPHSFGFTNCPVSVTVMAPEGATGVVVDFPELEYEQTNCPEGTVNPEPFLLNGQASGSFFDIGSHESVFTAYSCYSFPDFCFVGITVLPFSESEPGEYCDSKSEAPWEEWIEKVTLEDIDNPSGKCGEICGYSDFTNLIANLVVGETYPIALTEGKSWAGHVADLYWSVWIDLNGDGDFTDSGELMLEMSGDDKTMVGNISIPANNPVGTTRMRVAAKKGNYADPCETFAKGEVEDYSINISVSTAVVLDPNVENLYFTTQKNGREVILSWVTNIDSDYFEIERSKNNVDFTSIVKTNSLVQTANSMLTYQEVDASPMLGANYYRLKQVAEDGTVRYSESKLVEFDLDVNAIVLFPNPASTELFLNLKAFEGESADIQVFNQLGQPLLQKQLDEVEAETIRFDLDNYKSGVYLMTIKVADQRLITKRFVVSRL